MSHLSLERFTLLLLACTLSACGGGGGGSSGSTTPPPVTLTLSRSSLSVTASVSAVTPPTATLDITISNAPTGQNVYLGAGASNKGIAGLTAVQSGQGKVTVTVTFKDPSGLATGVYQDSLRFVACSDQACADIITGSEQDATSTYTVTAPDINAGPQLMLSPSSIQVSGNPGDFAPPAQQMVNITFNPQVTVPHFTMTVNATHKGLANVDPGTSQTGGNLAVNFQAPSQLLPGTYVDTVTVQGCYDSACVNPLGNPQTLTVTYTIPTSVAGPNGYALTVYPLLANDLIWDAVHKVIYLSVPSAAGANGNSIAAVDPTSGTVVASAAAGSEPGSLALSDDAQFLYVALRGANAVQRFVLPALTLDMTIQLPNDPFFGPIYANDLKVMPGVPHTLAVATSIQAEPNGNGVVIYDDAVARANSAVGAGIGGNINTIEWGSSASTLFGADSLPPSGGSAVYTLSVSAAGVAISAQTQDGANTGRLHYDGGLVYDDTGEVVDPTKTSGNPIVATCAPQNGVQPFSARAEAVDASLQKVFQLTSYENAVQLLSYQTGSCTPIAGIGFGGVQLDAYNAPHLVRWGTNGLAFLSQDGKLIIVSGAFVAP